MICSSCGEAITADRRGDNRFRGCEPCGWRMHHGCWVELLTEGALPCPTEEVPAVLWKNGKVKRPAYREYLAGHGGLWGLRGEFGD